MNQDRDLSRLYREAAREEPSPGLDRAILDAANKESARALCSPRRLRWQAPLALAAVLVLAVSLALTLDGALERAPVVDGTARESGYESDSRARMKREAQVLAPDAEARIQRQSAGPEFSVESDAPRMALPHSAKPPALGSGEVEANNAPAAPDGAKAGQPPVAARKPARELEGLPMEIPELSALDWRRRVEIEASRHREFGARAPRGASPEVAEPITPPEQWLREIERLRHEGREEEARTRLDAFRKRYPDYPLPQSLP